MFGSRKIEYAYFSALVLYYALDHLTLTLTCLMTDSEWLVLAMACRWQHLGAVTYIDPDIGGRDGFVSIRACAAKVITEQMCLVRVVLLMPHRWQHL